MSATYTLEVFAKGYSLTVPQLFDRTWMLYDIYKLPIYYRGRRITLIKDGNDVPEFFEVKLENSRDASRKRYTFIDRVDQFTVEQHDIELWFESAQSTRDNRATNPYNGEHLCTYGHTWFQAFLATMMSANRLLCWHITNRNQQNEDIKNPPPIVEATPGFFDTLKKKLFA